VEFYAAYSLLWLTTVGGGSRSLVRSDPRVTR
jgi:hypothetical protein